METINLSAFFSTKAQANDFLNRLSEVAKAAYQTNFDLEKVLTEQLGFKKKDLFIAILRDNKIQIESGPAVKAFLEELQEKIKSLPVLPLTLAFEPSEQTFKALSDWFELNLNKQLILDVSVDKKMIAGAAITFNGKFFDYSIRPRFEQIVKNVMTNPSPTEKPIHQESTQMHIGR
jgi:F0F1-type ATP synthase delta subunit